MRSVLSMMPRRIPRLKARAICLLLFVLAVPSTTHAQPQPPKDFVAVDETAPGEQIPAMPLIAGAYGFIWIVLLGYVWSIGRRLQKVEGELAELETRKPPFAEATGGRE
jgi:CcmD family protein